MGHTADILEEIRDEIAPEEITLKTARTRRADAIDAAKDLDGVARGYNSGSVAHGTANSDTDADGGIVLDRRVWTDLGPDGDDVGPCEVVEDVRSMVRDTLKDTYPKVKTRLSKRAIVLKFHEELSNGTDPSVDLIVGLQRPAGGLWIPNLEDDTWDPSDPIKHTELLTGDAKALRVARARVIRLAKAWNNQYSTPGMCSFNIEALALACITETVDLASGLAQFFKYSATDIAKRNTPDPADVSPAIKLAVDRDVMVDRLRQARDLLETALASDDDEDAVRTALADLYWKFVDPPEGASSKAAFANALRPGNAGVSMGSSLAVGTAGSSFKTGRAFGDGQRPRR
jgi:hypothetical protein